MKKLFLITFLAIAVFAVQGYATTITFEDLSGAGILPTNYHGLTWTDWAYYDSPQSPYNPSSGVERIYNYPNRDNTNLIQFGGLVDFTSLWLAGYSYGQYIVGYVGGVPVFTSTAQANDGTPFGNFINVNWNVDAISIFSNNGDYYIVDDVTYNSSVPDVGATLPLLGFSVAALGLLRRRIKV
jgi:hypothetical protein